MRQILEPCVLAAVLFAGLSCSSSDDTAAGSGREKPSVASADAAVPSPVVEEPEKDEGDIHPSSTRIHPSVSGPAPRGDPADDRLMVEVARATGARFSCVDEGPYRVIVEGPPARALSVVARTIRPVRKALARQYFEKGPRPVVRLVLFMHADTFKAGAAALSGEEPDTPFGYYSSELGAVIMNLATGGGTLVHEMVHTFVEEDFPGCPAWLNEGLGSLYEQCRIAPDRLIGLTNWRLPALKEALARDGKTGPARPGLPARVAATSTWEFYDADSGLNYAAARYLCYDLQERGLLERFYKEFRADVEKARTAGDVPADVASGRRTLERVLGQTLDEYEPAWRERTMKLKFR